MKRENSQFFLSSNSSRLINLLKCICCIGVVMLHTLFKEINVGNDNLVPTGSGWVTFVDISTIVYRTMVPMFFLLSGYLFFLNYKSFDLLWFIKKFRGRVNTLIIPYIFGIIIVYLFFSISSFLLKGIMSSGSSHDYNILTMFWYPLPNAVLWFLRDLIVVTLLSPLMLQLLEKTKWSLLVVIFFLWITDIWRFQIPGLSSISFLFFYSGVFLSIHQIDFINKICTSKYYIFAIFLYVIIVFLAYYYESELLTKISIFCGIPSIVLLSNRILPPPILKNIDFSFWMAASFFVYAYHVMVEVVIKKSLFTMIHPVSAVWNYVIYFATVFFSILILCLFYYVINKYAPKLSALLTGR